MIIIAIPKSASTSVMSTLGKIQNIEAKQDTISTRGLPLPKETKVLHNLHGDIRELNENLISLWNQSNIISKQHIFPTDNNMNLLHNSKKVILLRDPQEIILAYQRGVEKGIHYLPKGFKYGLSESQWLDNAKKIGLFDDLKLFYDKWMSSNNTNTLIIHYSEILNNSNEVFNKIETFFGLNITTSKIELSKKRFSQNKRPLIQNLRLELRKKVINTIVFLGLYDFYLRSRNPLLKR